MRVWRAENGRTQVLEWFYKLKSGVTLNAQEIHQQERHENVDSGKELVLKNRRITTNEVGNMLRFSFHSFRAL
jgi:hypothetical protein